MGERYRLNHAQALQEGADGLLLGKRPHYYYLKRCLQDYPAWQVHARQRLWNGLLEQSAQAFSSAGRLSELSEIINRIVIPYLRKNIGFDQVFVRQKKGGRWPLVAFGHDSWAAKNPTDRLENLPLVQRSVEADDGASISVSNISAADAGVYEVKLAGQSMYGRALRSGQFAVGALTMVRKYHDPLFEALDQWMFNRFADLVSGTLARLREIEREREVMQAIQEFISAVEAAHGEEVIAQTLCAILDRTLHQRPTQDDGYVLQATVSLRLVEQGTSLLRRFGVAGQDCGGITDIASESELFKLYENGIASGITTYLKNKNEIAAASPSLITEDSLSRKTGSALWVPIYIEKPTGDTGVIGAIYARCALEHAYSAEDVSLVEMLASGVAEVLQRIRAQRCVSALAQFAVKAYAQDVDHWQVLSDALFAFCGHSIMIQLARPESNGDMAPWRIERVLATKLAEQVVVDKTRWQQLFDVAWQGSFTSRCVEQFSRGENEPQYSDDQSKFSHWEHLLGNRTLRANCALAVRDSSGKLLGVLLLCWFHPPSLARRELPTLNRLATYASEVMRLGARWQDAETRLRANEQAARLGFASQTLEHVLNNKLADFSGQLSRLRQALKNADSDQAIARLDAAEATVESLSRRAGRSVRYMRPPSVIECDAALAWNEVTAELQQKANRANAQLTSPPSGLAPATTIVIADEEILWNVLYTLADNAIEAVENCAPDCARRIWLEIGRNDTNDHILLSVRDGGPGVQEGMRAHLFLPGSTSKPSHQGIALYIARAQSKT